MDKRLVLAGAIGTVGIAAAVYGSKRYVEVRRERRNTLIEPHVQTSESEGYGYDDQDALCLSGFAGSIRSGMEAIFARNPEELTRAMEMYRINGYNLAKHISSCGRPVDEILRNIFIGDSEGLEYGMERAHEEGYIL